MIEGTEIQLFPTVNWCIGSLGSTDIKLNKYQKYKRAKFNRYPVLGSNGTIQLSVPLKGGRNQKLTVSEIEIANAEGWQMRHWRTLFSCYNKSPWFEFYKESLQNHLFQRHENLFELDVASICWILERLKLEHEVIVIEERAEFERSEIRQVGSYYYPQVFEDRIGFVPNVSVLDLLFNLGPSAGGWLLNQIAKRNG